MKQLSICKEFVIIWLSFMLPCIACAQAIGNDSYQLVWQDTFDGTSLNENYWTIEENGDGSGNAEYQYYRKENISFGKEPETGENCLIITAKRENYLGKSFTSGRLISLEKVAFKYGKIEGRIKFPKTANGLWPAFWLMGDDYRSVGWPKCGEIDILEMGNENGIRNSTQERFYGGHFHWGEAWNGGAYPNWGRVHTAPYSLQDDFHLYTVIWDDQSIKMYLDLDKYPNNEPYLEMGINGGTEPGDAGRYFNKPFFVLLNLAVGGYFTGITGNQNINKITALNAANNYEAQMYVDYVKIYQKGDAGEEYTGPALTAIRENKANQAFEVYPNPAQENVHIKGGKSPVNVVLYNLAGQKVMDVQNVDHINISTLPVGDYLLKIENTENVETHKLNKIEN